MKLAACVYIQDPKTGRVVLTNRREDPNSFGLPGGKVEDDETPIEAAVREVYEETGIALTEDRLTPITTIISKGEVDYETTSFFATWEDHDGEDGEIPGGLEYGITAIWGDPDMLITMSPFAEYNIKMLETLRKTPNVMV